MAVRKGLGRGLDLLIPKDEGMPKKSIEKNKENKEPKENQVLTLSIHDVEPNRNQPRKQFDEDAIEELADSIKQYGVIQPLIVQKKDKYYEIIAGERRWRACKKAGLKEVPVIIKNYDEKETLKIPLIENLQREDLNFIEEAEAYYNLINEHNFTQDELAKRIGKKQSTIANKMRLLKLSSKVRLICLENSLTERHARALLSLPTEELQLKIIKKAIKNSLNVKKTEELINLELLKIAGEEMKKRKKGKGVLPGKLYVNTIKQVLGKFNIPAEYKLQEKEECIEITVSIPKNQ